MESNMKKDEDSAQESQQQNNSNNNNKINKELELELSPEVEGCIYSCNNGWISRGLSTFPCPICNSLI